MHGDEVQQVFSWALPNFLPTVSLMMSVFAQDALVRDEQEIDKVFVRSSFLKISIWISLFYVALTLHCGLRSFRDRRSTTRYVGNVEYFPRANSRASSRSIGRAVLCARGTEVAKTLSDGRPSSARTVSTVRPVSTFENPRLRRKYFRSSSDRATIFSRAARMPSMKDAGENLANKAYVLTLSPTEGSPIDNATPFLSRSKIATLASAPLPSRYTLASSINLRTQAFASGTDKRTISEGTAP